MNYSKYCATLFSNCVFGAFVVVLLGAYEDEKEQSD